MFILVVLFLLIVGLVLYKMLCLYVDEHSTILKEVKYLNEKYKFYDILEYKYIHLYDNEHSYNEISPKDYLIYQLMYEKNKVKEDIVKTIDNLHMYEMYTYDLEELKKLDPFDQPNNKYIVLLTKKIIEKKFQALVLKPTIEFKIVVIVQQTTINGHPVALKKAVFDVLEIEDIIARLNDKTYDRFNDHEIWNSLCKVERGKVSNKMRFSIYDRDGHRCRKCGRFTNDLEIDHIIPISKGGKSTYDNLQTLCRSCNQQKSNYIERNTFGVDSNTLICPKCGAPLKLKKGKYGSFYGCMNYPRCTYIKNR